MIDLSRWPEADDVLDAALALPVAERLDYVRRTATDAELIAALEAVLAEARAEDDFLAPAGAWSGLLARELRQATDDAGLALTPGFKLDHYEVVEAIGRGGMGEVYRARDQRLGRDVALKVVPARYVHDAERQARFKREARVLASLNHPGIGGIYGVADADGIEALVLELIEGPTLADRLRAGPLPIGEVVAVSQQLVDALEAAHTRGVLHRDLKPANIKIAPPATVKILDFGLARVLGPEPSADHDLSADSSRVLLGTASYMSPEQARGQAVDERSDIWAFGCVVFEMLTGTRAFAGDSVTAVLAAVIEREPSFDQLPPSTPAPMRRLLRRCLAKDRDRRLGLIADARFELEEALVPPADATVPGHRPAARTGLIAALLLTAAAAAGAAIWYYVSRPDGSALVSRLVLPLPEGDEPVLGFQPMAALSPDGRTLVYRARRGGVIQLFRRDLDSLEAVPLAGTEDGSSPFFSPDGRWLGFDADGILKRVGLAGDLPVVICPAPGGATAAWLPDNTIVFATNTTRVLQRVSASGGTPQTLSALDPARGDTLHLLPEAVPGGKAVLFTVVAGVTRHVAAMDLATRRISVIGEGSSPRFVAGGSIVFVRDGALWGAPFAVDRLALTGAAVPFTDRVAQTDNVVSHYAVSTSGTLVYAPPLPSGQRQRVIWLDRAGAVTPVDVEPRPYVRLALAPDGVRLALVAEENGNTDVWIADPSRNTMSRLTFEPTIETMPVWSPDGRFVAFRSEREGPGIFKRDAQGTGRAERLSATEGPIHSPYSWTPDGKTVLLAVFRSFRQQAIASVTPPETRVRILLDGDFAQLDPQVSPDGRWLAYQSDETGRFEIYVRPYPDVDAGRWLVSNAGGTSPRWGPDGRELFYLDGEALLTVPIESATTFAAGRPRRLAAIKPFGGRLGPDLEVSPDGQRFLFLIPDPAPAPRTAGMVVVQNFIRELRARLNAR